MSDRLAVMSNGRVEQIGSPSDVYEEPTTAYVADFLGMSNLMDAEAEGPTPKGRGRSSSASSRSWPARARRTRGER